MRMGAALFPEKPTAENYTNSQDMTRYTTPLALAWLCLTTTLFATSNQESYFQQYLDIAITESARSGIPVSIILAQGGLESAWGNGRLAVSARNHFGIKCKSEWTGPTFHLEDDDYDAQGKLTKSCFRAYPSAEQSYLDHTDFLVERARYRPCFAFPRTDYRNWAHALKRAGYATDARYAEKLIRIIETNGLYRYDQPRVLVATPLAAAGSARVSQPVFRPAPVVPAEPAVYATTTARPTNGQVTGQYAPPALTDPYASRTNAHLRRQRRTYVAGSRGVRLMTTRRTTRVRRR